MPYEVFKVVREQDGKFFSLYMRGLACFEYTLGEEIKSDTPIFVYTDIHKAHKIAQHSNKYRLLRGTTTTKPIHLIEKTNDILNIDQPYSREMIQEFWRLIKEGVDDPFFEFIPMSVNEATYGIYNFTPIEELQFFYPLRPIRGY